MARFVLTAAVLALLGASTLSNVDFGLAHADDTVAAGLDGGCCCEVCGCDQCCVVPEVKTVRKWVYATKFVPYCRTKCPSLLKCRHDSCDTCPDCEECVRYKRVLVKRAVVTKKTEYKCVPVCEACRAKAAAAAPRSPAAAPGIPVAQPGEPQAAPPSAAPAPIE